MFRYDIQIVILFSSAYCTCMFFFSFFFSIINIWFCFSLLFRFKYSCFLSSFVPIVQFYHEHILMISVCLGDWVVKFHRDSAWMLEEPRSLLNIVYDFLYCSWTLFRLKKTRLTEIIFYCAQLFQNLLISKAKTLFTNKNKYPNISVIYSFFTFSFLSHK